MAKINKRGVLLTEEALKMIVSFIVIIFLVGLLFYIYYSRVYNGEVRHAQSSLDRISEVINAKGGSVEGITPEGWSLVSFVDEIRPNSCYNKDCLCICLEDSLESCSEEGVCLNVENLEKF